ncbi:hypothetical protein FIBSPDRAFT_863063 [Athelia psychrophila]|uniref:Uncharacterized protein n=1 Tax=Athelia psychrophila TaxID=1759441 RepID=A0A166HR74_9AGAM|nr:hypothetical protein FIBSPDRAFT_863063 [Fibularhizoctonia sp. CBS 109695]
MAEMRKSVDGAMSMFEDFECQRKATACQERGMEVMRSRVAFERSDKLISTGGGKLPQL